MKALYASPVTQMFKNANFMSIWKYYHSEEEHKSWMGGLEGSFLMGVTSEGFLKKAWCWKLPRVPNRGRAKREWKLWQWGVRVNAFQRGMLCCFSFPAWTHALALLSSTFHSTHTSSRSLPSLVVGDSLRAGNLQGHSSFHLGPHLNFYKAFELFSYLLPCPPFPHPVPIHFPPYCQKELEGLIMLFLCLKFSPSPSPAWHEA